MRVQHTDRCRIVFCLNESVDHAHELVIATAAAAAAHTGVRLPCQQLRATTRHDVLAPADTTRMKAFEGPRYDTIYDTI
jgi:hypothetical protein